MSLRFWEAKVGHWRPQVQVVWSESLSGSDPGVSIGVFGRNAEQRGRRRRRRPRSRGCATELFFRPRNDSLTRIEAPPTLPLPREIQTKHKTASSCPLFRPTARSLLHFFAAPPVLKRFNRACASANPIVVLRELFQRGQVVVAVRDRRSLVCSLWHKPHGPTASRWAAEGAREPN